MHHLVGAGDLREAADVIASSWADIDRERWLGTIERWIGMLPPELVRADARLCLARAWTAISLSRTAEIVPWIEAAEAAEPSGPLPAGMRSISDNIVLARAIERCQVGDTGAALAHARRAIAAETDRESIWRVVALLALGLSLHGQGDLGGAREALAEAAESGQRLGAFVPTIVALQVVAELDRQAGALDAAERGARLGPRSPWPTGSATQSSPCRAALTRRSRW